MPWSAAMGLRRLCLLQLYLAGAVLARSYKEPTLEDYIEGFVIGGVEDDRLPTKQLYPEVDCRLSSQRGHCRALIVRWRYDVNTKECREFKFGGCGGNANNFLTKKLCMKACKGI